MDPLTQGLLGATCGQAFYAERLGLRRATWWGAAAGMLPDLDVVPIAFLGPLAEFRYHRAMTHSLWFGLIAGPLLGYLAWRWTRRREAGDQGEAGPSSPDVGPGASPRSALSAWVGLCVLALVTHPLLDWCTTYGTMLLWPNLHRFALDAVAIIDPLYTLILAAALVIGRWAWGRAHGAGVAATAGLAALVLSTGFLFYGLHLNERAKAEARRQLEPLAGAGVRVDAYPTLFQPWLRRVVARSGDTVWVGLLSTWRLQEVSWRSFREPRDARIDAARATPEGALYEWFAMGQTSARVVAGPGGEAEAASAASSGGARGGPAWVEIDDLRYGYGSRPDHGLWALRVPVDEHGRPRAPVTRVNRRPTGSLAATLAALWRATFGS